MEFISDIILPDEKREPFFDGRERQLCYYRFKCQVCENPMKIAIWDFIKANQDWAQEFNEVEIEQIVKHFSFRKVFIGDHVYYKSYFEGEVYVGIKQCGACHQNYLIYIDFYEKQWGRSIATIQGLVRI